MSLATTAVRGAAVSLSGQFIRLLLQILSLVVLARLLSPRDFGLVAMVTAVTGVAELIRDFGLSSAAIQSKTLSDGERSNLLWVNTGIGLACSIVAVVAAPLFVKIYGTPAVEPIVYALAGLFVVSGFNTQYRADLSRHLRFNALAITDLTAQTLAVTTAIVMAAAGCGHWSIVGQQAVLVIVATSMNVLQCGWLPRLYQRDVSITRFFRFGGGVLGSQVLNYTTSNVDNVAIGAVWGAGPLGLYSRGYQLLLGPMQQVNDTMSRVVLPVLSRVHEDSAAFSRYAQGAQVLGCYFLATVFSVIAGVATPLVLIMFGASWAGVAPILVAIALGAVFRGQTQVPYWMFLSHGQTTSLLRMYLLMSPLMVALLLAGLPWGPVGVAVGHGIAYFVYWVVALWRGCVITGVSARLMFGQAVRSLLVVSGPAGLLAYVGTRAVHQSPIAQLAAGCGLAATYLLLVFTLSPTERTTLRRILRRFRRSSPPSAAVATGEQLLAASVLHDVDAPEADEHSAPARDLTAPPRPSGETVGHNAPRSGRDSTAHDGERTKTQREADS